MSDIEKVKKLRQSTGAGFKDCNAALKESNGDLDKAAEILRVKGIAKASKKMSRDAKEGVIVVSGDNKKTSLIEVNCETDFVAKNEDFLNFCRELSEINFSVEGDIEKLNELISNNLRLGLTIKDSNIPKDLSDSRKPENLLIGLGIDTTRKFFKSNKYLDPIKENILKNFSKSSFLKKITKRVANLGLN